MSQQVPSADERTAALHARYGVPASARTRKRRVVIGIVLAVVALGAFLALAISSTNEPVRTQDLGYQTIDDSHVELTFAVHLAGDTRAECDVAALNSNFAEVGRVTVPAGPVEGNEPAVVTAEVTTAEPAQAARVTGCHVVEEP